MSSLVLTVIGDDRPGLVSAVATTVANFGGNWLDSQMARLAGQFAGIVLVDVPADRRDGFAEALTGLGAEGLTISVTPSDAPDPELTGAHTLRLHLIGNDRPGIVSHVSEVLADKGVTIEELHTATLNAPMGGGVLFEADLTIILPPTLRSDDVRAALEEIAHELLVDIELSETI